MKLVILGIFLSGALLLGACGGDDAGSVATAAKSTVATVAATEARTTPKAVSTLPAATAPAASATAGSLAGTWTGTWRSSATTDHGNVTIVWTQTGQQLAGTITVTGTPCLTEGTITGTVNGAEIQFGAVKGAVTIAYTGTVSGRTIFGDYKASAACGNAVGKWDVVRA